MKLQAGDDFRRAISASSGEGGMMNLAKEVQEILDMERTPDVQWMAQIRHDFDLLRRELVAEIARLQMQLGSQSEQIAALEKHIQRIANNVHWIRFERGDKELRTGK